jgi:glycosyltransferase involved in cell wall biosynthesis
MTYGVGHDGARPKVAVILPCYNEAVAITETISGFRAALPDAEIYVYDNNSKDNTVAVAQAVGAIVRIERMQGKGHVVRRMFADIEADIYVLADGDATYDATAAPAMVRKLWEEQLDMVVGARQSEVVAGLPPWPCTRQPFAHRTARPDVRPQFQRHIVGLQGVLAPLRQELSGAVGRF